MAFPLMHEAEPQIQFLAGLIGRPDCVGLFGNFARFLAGIIAVQITERRRQGQLVIDFSRIGNLNTVNLKVSLLRLLGIEIGLVEARRFKLEIGD